MIDWYENASEIVADYYNGHLEEEYPILVKAIKLIVEKEAEKEALALGRDLRNYQSYLLAKESAEKDEGHWD